MQKKNLVGTYIGGIPVHYAFDEGLHELATPAGKELKASNLTIRGACLAEPLPNAIIFSYIVTSTIKLPTGLVGSIFWTAFCADSTIFTLSKQHGNTITDIGFFRFEAENSFGSVEFAQDEELSPGDKLLIKAPISLAPISLNGNISFAWTIKALNLPAIITTPEACFQIASDGVIVNYDHNGGNEVIIPATINNIPVIGVASTAFNDEAYDDELPDFLETNVVTTSLSLDDIKEKWREVFPIERLDLSQTSITIIEPRTYRKLGIIDLILPKTLVDIGASAFEYNNIDYLRPFPVSLLQIREKAFYHNKIGGTIFVPQNLNFIGAYAFTDNTITNIVFPIEEEFGDIDIKEWAFAFNEIEEINIPTFASLSDGAFAYNKIVFFKIGEVGDIPNLLFYRNKIANIGVGNGINTLPEFLIRVGDHAFDKNELIDVVLPDTVREIGQYAFCGLPDTSTTYLRHEKYRNLIGNSLLGSKNAFLLPPELLYIRTHAFAYTSIGKNDGGLYAMAMPDTLVSIEESAFEGTSALLALGLTNENNIELPTNTTHIGKKAFAFNSDVPAGLTLTLSSNIPIIAESAFESSGLERLIVPEGITKLEDKCFHNNYITDIELPLSLTEIGNNVFLTPSEKTSHNGIRLNPISTIILKNNTQIINYKKMFLGSLTQQLTLAGDIDVVPADACSITEPLIQNPLQILVLNPQITEIGDNAFAGNALVELALLGYQAGSGIQRIGHHAFYKCALADIAFGEGINEIGDSAFADNQLISVSLPNSLTGLGEGAFAGNKIVNLTLPISSGFTDIPVSAFTGNRIANLFLPLNIARIDHAAFLSNQIHEVTITDNVQFIGELAFAENHIANLNIAQCSPMLIVQDGAFKDNLLVSLYLPDQIGSFGNFVFEKNPITVIVGNELIAMHAGNKNLGEFDVTLADSFAVGGNGTYRYYAIDNVWKKTISQPEINIEPPVTNAVIPSDPIDTDEFTGFILNWMIEGSPLSMTANLGTMSTTTSTFLPETTYKLELEIVPKQYYTLDGVSDNFFTIPGASETLYTPGSSVVTATFPATESAPVVGIRIQPDPFYLPAVSNNLPAHENRNFPPRLGFVIPNLPFVVRATNSSGSTLDTQYDLQLTYSSPGSFVFMPQTNYEINAIALKRSDLPWNKDYNMSEIQAGFFQYGSPDIATVTVPNQYGSASFTLTCSPLTGPIPNHNNDFVVIPTDYDPFRLKLIDYVGANQLVMPGSVTGFPIDKVLNFNDDEFKERFGIWVENPYVPGTGSYQLTDKYSMFKGISELIILSSSFMRSAVIGGTSYSFAVDGFAFQGSGATNVKLASSVKAIPDQAFYNRGGGVGNYCTVTSIQLGNNVALGFDVLGEFPDPGFKTTYDNGGKLGGIYQKNGSSWSRVSSETLDV